MRKIFSKIIVVALCAMLMFSLASCSDTAVPPVGERKTIITAEKMDSILRDYLKVSDDVPYGDGGSRVYTSDSATDAAKLLHDRYSKTSDSQPVYKNIEVTSLEDSKFTVNKRDAYNVVVRYRSPSTTDSKQVIIGTSYDNSYGKAEEDKSGSTTLGAMGTATSVALIMSLIEYFGEAKPDLGFDVVFCFFAGAFRSAGSLQYIENTMTVAEKQNTLLMVNITRLGSSNLYIYSDEVQTEHNEFLYTVGAENGLSFNRLPKNLPILEQKYIDKVPYTHYPMIGDHAPFMVSNIPVANIYGGYLGGFNLSNIEVKGKANLGGTADDSYKYLKQYRDNYAVQMQDTATLMINALEAATFADVMTSSRNNVYDYSWATQTLWVQIGVLGMIVLLIVLVILLVKHFEKKYPYVPKVKRLRIAVFGLDYEKQTDEDVFVDIKKKRDPFGGY